MHLRPAYKTCYISLCHTHAHIQCYLNFLYTRQTTRSATYKLQRIVWFQSDAYETAIERNIANRLASMYLITRIGAAQTHKHLMDASRCRRWTCRICHKCWLKARPFSCAHCTLCDVCMRVCAMCINIILFVFALGASFALYIFL